MLRAMANRATWAKRVEQWRRSGLSSEDFCAGKGFTPGGLRNAACVIERESAATKKALSVPVARVVRTSVPAGRAVTTAKAAASLGDVELIIELGAARVAVRRGCDAATLKAVLEVLGGSGGGR